MTGEATAAYFADRLRWKVQVTRLDGEGEMSRGWLHWAGCTLYASCVGLAPAR